MTLVIAVSASVLVTFGGRDASSALAYGGDSDGDGVPDDVELDLSRRFAPCLQFTSQENFYPVDVTYHINNSVLKLYLGEGEYELIDLNPTVDELTHYTAEDYFLDNKLGSFTGILSDYRSRLPELGYTVYVRVTEELNHYVIQYWLFYAFNDGDVNQHEGGWEVVEVVLGSDGRPMYAVYSQHQTRQRADWGLVEKVDDTHPVVYVARGSHANYFRPYQGSLGLASDVVGSDGVRLCPADYELVLLGEIGGGSPNAKLGWLLFGGRWGDWGSDVDEYLGFAGPYGPGHGDNYLKWFSPLEWGFLAPEVDNRILALSWVVSNSLLIFVGISALLAARKVYTIYKLGREGGLGLRRFRGAALLSIALLVASMMLVVAGMLIPWYSVSADIKGEALQTEELTDIAVLDGVRGLQVNLLTGGGLTPLIGVRIPLWVLLAAGAILTSLDLIALRNARKLGSKYIISGALFFVILAVLIVGIVQFASNLESLAVSLGIEDIPDEVGTILGDISASPVSGESLYHFENGYDVHLVWGFSVGLWLLTLSAALKVAGGIALRKAGTVAQRT